MKAHLMTIFVITSFNFQFTSQTESNSKAAGKNRRILHQPLFPETSAPQTPPPPPPPPPLVTLEDPDEDQPFINELPTGTPTTPYEEQQQPPPLPADGTAVVANPTTSHPPPNPAKKLAVVVSSAVLTLGMLMGMGFYLHKHRRSNSPDEAQKFFDGSPERMINHETRMLPPTLAAAVPSSSYQKLGSASGFGPEFRPPPPASLLHSPPPMSSSDDESGQDNGFNRTPPARPENFVSTCIPHSKRTSPKSRLSPSPSTPVKQSPSPVLSFGPLQPSRALKYSPKRAKFSPPQGSERRLSTANDEPSTGNMRIPQPPPPPPSRPSRNWAAKTSSRPMQRLQSKSPSPAYEKIQRPIGDVDRNGPRPKMKPLHWDKVGATLDTPTVWDRLRTSNSSFQLNEGAMESLFGRNSPNVAPKQANGKLTLPPFKLENRILDSKKSQNIAILLRALNLTRDEVCEALLDGNPEGLGPELFETLVKMAPSKEEETRLKKCDDRSSNMGPAERFLRALLDIPFAFQRVEALLYRANFNAEVEYLRKSFKTLEEASDELKNSHLFLKLLEAVLRTGNRMNDGTNRGSAKAFKLDTLLKLADVKGTDGKTTLLHFVVQEMIRSEQIRNPAWNPEHDVDSKGQSVRIVSGLGKELANVKKAASMDSDILSGYLSKLEAGMDKVREVVQLESQSLRGEGRFFDSMKEFHREARDEIARVRAEERKALSLVREVTCYFHGDAEKGDARALRIFVIVRDFLGILDIVCKDVGRTMHDREAGGGGRSFRISATASLPVLGRYNEGKDGSSDDDSM